MKNLFSVLILVFTCNLYADTSAPKNPCLEDCSNKTGKEKDECIKKPKAITTPSEQCKEYNQKLLPTSTACNEKVSACLKKPADQLLKCTQNAMESSSCQKTAEKFENPCGSDFRPPVYGGKIDADENTKNVNEYNERHPRCSKRIPPQAAQ